MNDLFEPYEKLVPIFVVGRRLEVPENNVLLRQLQFVAPDIGYGKYCWNGECRYCEVHYRRANGSEVPVLACRVRGTPGIRLTRLAPEVKYNLSEALATAPQAPEEGEAEPIPLPPEPTFSD